MREVPTMLLLHGGPGFDHSGFKPDFSKLTDIAQIVYFDHRGCGRSDRGSVDGWKLDRWADDVRAVCDALDIEGPIVIGQSFGGAVAVAYALRHPDHPSKLVLSSPLLQSIDEACFATFERLGGSAARRAAIDFWMNPCPSTRGDYFAHCMPLMTRGAPSPDFLSRTVRHPEVADHFFGRELKSLDLVPHMSRIRCPTLIIGGEDDPVTTIGHIADAAAAISPDLVRFHRFADAGHGVFRDRPQEFFALLREFLAAG
jgi:proline iminopeptidase